MDNLEKVVAELKHLDGDELNKVWGFALGPAGKPACRSGSMTKGPGNRPGGRRKEYARKG